MPAVIWDLGEGQVGHRDVVGGGVAARPARPQDRGERLVGVVQPDRQWVVAEAGLERRAGELLVAVADHQGRVDDQPQARPLPAGPPTRPESARRSRCVAPTRRSRATTRAARTAASRALSMLSRTRQAVAVEATVPNSSGRSAAPPGR